MDGFATGKEGGKRLSNVTMRSCPFSVQVYSSRLSECPKTYGPIGTRDRQFRSKQPTTNKIYGKCGVQDLNVDYLPYPFLDKLCTYPEDRSAYCQVRNIHIDTEQASNAWSTQYSYAVL